MYFIDIADTQNVMPVDEAFLRGVIEKTLEAEQVAGAELSVALVDNPMIHELNIRYLEHDYDTDVLSFLFDSTGGDEAAARRAERDGRDAPPRGAGKRIEGEIIVSVEMALDMAREYGWNARDELLLYVVHGILHLTGYDDLTPREKEIMRNRERAVLALWGLVPRYAEDTSPSPPREETP